MLPSEEMLGENVPVSALIESGRRLGSPHPDPSRSTRQRFPPCAGNTLPSKFPSIGLLSSPAGRFVANTRNDPSGAIVGSRSFHLPEKGASAGVDHSPFTRCEARIIEPESFPRVKNTVFPSGVNAGDASSAAPEITPGPNNRGLFEIV